MALGGSEGRGLCTTRNWKECHGLMGAKNESFLDWEPDPKGGRTVCCARAVRKVGHFPPGDRVLSTLSWQHVPFQVRCWYYCV